eukprot:Filipodium_phascolosomae@DN2821_c0_g1_i1.p1
MLDLVDSLSFFSNYNYEWILDVERLSMLIVWLSYEAVVANQFRQKLFREFIAEGLRYSVGTKWNILVLLFVHAIGLYLVEVVLLPSGCLANLTVGASVALVGFLLAYLQCSEESEKNSGGCSQAMPRCKSPETTASSTVDSSEYSDGTLHGSDQDGESSLDTQSAGAKGPSAVPSPVPAAAHKGVRFGEGHPDDSSGEFHDEGRVKARRSRLLRRKSTGVFNSPDKKNGDGAVRLLTPAAAATYVAMEAMEEKASSLSPSKTNKKKSVGF